MITIQDVLMQGTSMLNQHSDSDTPYLDAILLMAHTLNKTKEQILASLPDPIWEVDALSFGKVIQKRSKGIPIAYILNRKEFYGLEFYVDHRVLIPRPDTEIVVETVLDLVREHFTAPVDILDMCAGSGCIGIAIKHELSITDPNREVSVTLADISEDALSVCALNARTILGKELPLVNTDLFDHIDGEFDIIAGNPPYLTHAECDDPAVKARREPDNALRSGNDGLYHIRSIIKQGYTHLKLNGYLVLEGGYNQAETIRTLLIGNGYTDVRIIQDLGGNNRVVLGKRTH